MFVIIQVYFAPLLFESSLISTGIGSLCKWLQIVHGTPHENSFVLKDGLGECHALIPALFYESRTIELIPNGSLDDGSTESVKKRILEIKRRYSDGNTIENPKS